MRFVRPPLLGRVVFGAGALERLDELVNELGGKRPVLIGSASAESLVSTARRLLHPREVGVTLGARAHVPTSDVEETVRRVAEHGADGLVALGGGSAIGLAKAVAVATEIPIIAVPTTYSGSEMTMVYGATEAGRKHVQRSSIAAPRIVIYDPSLTVDLPRAVTIETGVNAVAHCVEALYASQADPAMTIAARKGLHELIDGLPRLASVPEDLAARERVLLGAYCAGLALAGCGMGLHHRICHVLGGASLAPHGKLNAAVLAHVVALNAGHAPMLRDALVEELGGSDVTVALWDWLTDLGAPTSLPDAGAGGLDLDEVAASVVEPPPPNPAPVSHAVVRELLERARMGVAPGLAVDEDAARENHETSHD